MSTNPATLQYEGDEPLWCLLGVHAYEFSRCKHCRRKQPMIDLPLPNKTRASRSSDYPADNAKKERHHGQV